MKLIHLSDLHLGKRMNEAPMSEEQRYMLRNILEIVKEEQARAVLIAGDIYDRVQPSADAMNMLDSFLSELADADIAVFAISGNHDMAERIAFGGRIMEKSGIYMSSVFEGKLQKHILYDEHGPLNIYMLPFVKPLHVKAYYEEVERGDYTGAVARVIREADEGRGIDKTERNVLIAHQFVTGAERSDSEEQVGGLDNVDAEVFRDFDYVALGHLHRAQSVGNGESRVQYCGAPLKYSFSEINDAKTVNIVDVGEKGTVRIRREAVRPLHEMREIRGRFDELMKKSFYEDTDYTDAYLKVTLTDGDIVPDAVRRMRSVYKNILELKYDREITKPSAEKSADIERQTPIEIFEEFYGHVLGRPMTSQQRHLVEEKIEQIREEKR